MKNFKKYITINLLSIFGYIFLAFILIVFFYLFPQMKERFTTSGGGFNAYAELLILSLYTALISAIIEFSLIIFAFPAEFLIYKLSKTEPKLINIPDKFSKIHLIALLFGILIAILPLITVFYLLTHPV